MSSSAIVALFRASLTSISAAFLIGLSPVSGLAESAQTQFPAAVNTVAAAEQQGATGAAITGASTILKTTATAQPVRSSAATQPIPSAPPQLLPASAMGPLPTKGVPGLTGVTTPSTAGGTTPVQIGTVAAKVPNPATNAVPAAQSQLDGIELLSPKQRLTYERAASAFTAFCHDWERLLHEREVDNLDHLSWRENGGLETASYTGYGKVESCQCKASKEGLPIGKIRYREINYSIAGKTIDQARHAIPKLTHEISTLEIFSWDKNKWFY